MNTGNWSSSSFSSMTSTPRVPTQVPRDSTSRSKSSQQLAYLCLRSHRAPAIMRRGCNFLRTYVGPWVVHVGILYAVLGKRYSGGKYIDVLYRSGMRYLTYTSSHERPWHTLSALSISSRVSQIPRILRATFPTPFLLSPQPRALAADINLNGFTY